MRQSLALESGADIEPQGGQLAQHGGAQHGGADIDEEHHEYEDEYDDGDTFDNEDEYDYEYENEESVFSETLQNAQSLVFSANSNADLQRGIDLLKELASNLLDGTPQAGKRVDGPAVSTGTQRTDVRQSARDASRSQRSNVDAHTESDLEVLASAAFTLGALTASGVAGDALARDPVASVRLYAAAAHAGSIEAHLALAKRYETGDHLPQLCDKAFAHLQIAADALAAQVEASGDTAERPLPVVLRERWRDASYVADAELLLDEARLSMEFDLAERGDADAQRVVAYRQLAGLGMEADWDGALDAFTRAAAAGDPYALFNLGYMHLAGNNGTANYTAARGYFQQAAALGLPSAHSGLGLLHYHGRGVPANLTAARLEWETGAALGDPDSTFNLAGMFYEPPAGAGIGRDVARAHALLLDAHAAGHWKAPLLLGSMLHGDAAVPGGPNCTLALRHLWTFVEERGEWTDALQHAVDTLDGELEGQTGPNDWEALLEFALLAEQGSEVAIANAAWMLERGMGVRGEAAETLLQHFHSQGVAAGITMLMVDAANALLARASRAPPDDGPALAARGVQLFESAAALGDVEAATAFAWAHSAGVGVPQNSSRAAELYRAALSLAGDDAVLAWPPRIALAWLCVSDAVRGVLPTAVTQHTVRLLVRVVGMGHAQLAAAVERGSESVSSALAPLGRLWRQALRSHGTAVGRAPDLWGAGDGGGVGAASGDLLFDAATLVFMTLVSYAAIRVLRRLQAIGPDVQRSWQRVRAAISRTASHRSARGHVQAATPDGARGEAMPDHGDEPAAAGGRCDVAGEARASPSSSQPQAGDSKRGAGDAQPQESSTDVADSSARAAAASLASSGSYDSGDGARCMAGLRPGKPHDPGTSTRATAAIDGVRAEPLCRSGGSDGAVAAAEPAPSDLRAGWGALADAGTRQTSPERH